MGKISNRVKSSSEKRPHHHKHSASVEPTVVYIKSEPEVIIKEVMVPGPKEIVERLIMVPSEAVDLTYINESIEVLVKDQSEMADRIIQLQDALEEEYLSSALLVKHECEKREKAEKHLRIAFLVCFVLSIIALIK